MQPVVFASKMGDLVRSPTRTKGHIKFVFLLAEILTMTYGTASPTNCAAARMSIPPLVLGRQHSCRGRFRSPQVIWISSSYLLRAICTVLSLCQLPLPGLRKLCRRAMSGIRDADGE